MDTQTILEQQEETAARIQSAFENFKQVYSTMNPPPIASGSNNRWYHIDFNKIADLSGLLGAIIVSASHTMPVLVGVDSVTDIELGSILFVLAIASFAMIEIMAIRFAYNATLLDASKDKSQRVANQTKKGKYFLGFILILFNTYYVLSANSVPIPDAMRVFIFLTIGTSAPIVAFITGDIWAINSIRNRVESKRADDEYQAIYQEWLDGLNKRWQSQQKKWGGQVNIQVAAIHSQAHSLNGANEQPLLEHSLNGSLNGANTGYSKKMNARVVITQWFEANPSYLKSNETVDELHKLFTDATKQKVGRTSVHNVRKELRSK